MEDIAQDNLLMLPFKMHRPRGKWLGIPTVFGVDSKVNDGLFPKG